MSRTLFIFLLIAAVTTAALAGYCTGAALVAREASWPAAAASDECEELRQELAAAKSSIAGLESKLGQQNMLVQDLQVKLTQLEADLELANAHLDQLATLGNQAALGLARLLLDHLMEGRLDLTRQLTQDQQVELYVQYEDGEDYGFASEDPRLWSSLIDWIKQHQPPTAPEHFFLEGYSDFRNVVFIVADGFLWFQISDEWSLVKIRASLTDPRNSSI